MIQAFALRFSAQYAFIRSDRSLFFAADIPADLDEAGRAYRGTRAPLYRLPWASIAQFTLSRSATSNGPMCLVAIASSVT